MAISVKSIREMEFSRSKHGYDMNEVDDFLDEIAEQLTAIIEENMELAKQINEQPAAPAAPVEEAPAYNEGSYFKNLESTLRETLIAGQRIADDTIAKAQKEADEIIAAAKAEAKGILTEANSQMEEATAAAEQIVADAEKKLDDLKVATDAIKAQIKGMIEAQQKLIAE